MALNMLKCHPALAFIIFAIFTWTAAAQEATNGQNSITYPLDGNVVDGLELPITWTVCVLIMTFCKITTKIWEQPSTEGTVSLHLLKGPQDNLDDLGPIAGMNPPSDKPAPNLRWKREPSKLGNFQLADTGLTRGARNHVKGQ